MKALQLQPFPAQDCDLTCFGKPNKQASPDLLSVSRVIGRVQHYFAGDVPIFHESCLPNVRFRGCSDLTL